MFNTSDISVQLYIWITMVFCNATQYVLSMTQKFSHSPISDLFALHLTGNLFLNCISSHFQININREPVY